MPFPGLEKEAASRALEGAVIGVERQGIFAGLEQDGFDGGAEEVFDGPLEMFDIGVRAQSHLR